MIKSVPRYQSESVKRVAILPRITAVTCGQQREEIVICLDQTTHLAYGMSRITLAARRIPMRPHRFRRNRPVMTNELTCLTPDATTEAMVDMIMRDGGVIIEGSNS